MRNATWTSVEAMGIPPSRVRDVLFDLAGIIDAPLAGEELALGSSALRGVMAALEEHYKPRTALEVQVEMIRVGRELAEMGMPVPAIAFTHEDFELPPESPQELARQLGYRDGGRAVRQVLRRGFPEHPAHTTWVPLTKRQVNYVRAHLASRTDAASP